MGYKNLHSDPMQKTKLFLHILKKEQFGLQIQKFYSIIRSMLLAK